MKLTVIHHYSKNDPECDEDYGSVEIMLAGVRIASWGDHYHDKGSEKVEGFLAGVAWVTGEPTEVSYENLADDEMY